MDSRIKHRSDFRQAKIVFEGLLVVAFWLLSFNRVRAIEGRWWQYQSVDTMKYSRDLAREKLNDPSFDATIENQLNNIVYTGANYVSIGTPYDEEFYPFLKRWVTSARKKGLKIWYRGNFSGWEGWFGYQTINRDQHRKLLTDFINNHSELFEDGDIFDPCPEAENGGPGDPRQSGDISGFRDFVISEYNLTQKLFKQTGKVIITNFASSNGDVARVVYDKETVKKMGGVVAIDHYVESPTQLVADINKIYKETGAQIVLGEFGAPVPDIHGTMSEEEQAKWINELLDALTDNEAVIGLNYWTNVGSSTGLWLESGKSKMGVEILRKYFQPKTITITVRDKYGNNLQGVDAHYHHRIRKTDSSGKVVIPTNDKPAEIYFEKGEYLKLSSSIKPGETESLKIMTKISYNWLNQLINPFLWAINKMLRKI